MLDLYRPQRQAAGECFRRLLEGCSQAGAVDIGWEGSGAVSLSFAAQKLWGLDCSITGLLAGTNSAHSPERDAAEPLLLTGDLVSYLFSQSHNRDLWKLHNPRQGHNLFWELLLGGEEGGLRGFSPGEETGWRLELGENPHSGAVGEIHRGLLDFARILQTWKSGWGCPWPSPAGMPTPPCWRCWPGATPPTAGNGRRCWMSRGLDKVLYHAVSSYQLLEVLSTGGCSTGSRGRRWCCRILSWKIPPVAAAGGTGLL